MKLMAGRIPKLLNKTVLKFALVYLAIGVVLFFYYEQYKTVLPFSYFWIALILLILGIAGKFHFDKRIRDRFSDFPHLIKVVDLVFDAVLVGSLIFLFVYMYPNSPRR